METINERDMAFSRIESSVRMQPVHGNPQGTVHGGELIKFMEDTAGIAAMKHAGGNVVAARVDELVFHKPINIGSIVTFIAQVAYAGSTSMQVILTVVVHDLNNFEKSETALTAFFTMVHLDNNGRPKKIPTLKFNTDIESELYALGEKKYNENKNKPNTY
ncbi:acyl-CoA thioesterase [Alkalibaculum sp. M08DMB]|uniref:Acyl-CoA thioesterase n=1 Tax=Alkalibaculum sporogenes TaxID=2655001 RepID=A0A6A7KB72_9FIRM|nr:acyl-CoA thioesterase [Alkalibaculum sporogenes]MPW26531.1 acyl-CoA thioesterase [Alkalibaculum sporogenes]